MLSFLTVGKCYHFCVIIFSCTAWVLSFMLSFNVIIFCYHFLPFSFSWKRDTLKSVDKFFYLKLYSFLELYTALYLSCILSYYIVCFFGQTLDILLRIRVPWAKNSSLEHYVRGVLGNKCAGQHNLKTVDFRETLVSGNFLACSSAICVFICSPLSIPGRQGQAFM